MFFLSTCIVWVCYYYYSSITSLKKKNTIIHIIHSLSYIIVSYIICTNIASYASYIIHHTYNKIQHYLSHNRHIIQHAAYLLRNTYLYIIHHTSYNICSSYILVECAYLVPYNRTSNIIYLKCKWKKKPKTCLLSL